MALRANQNLTVGADALLKIGEVAKLSSIGIEALRFYERSGLLGRPGRTQSGYRLYELLTSKPAEVHVSRFGRLCAIVSKNWMSG